MLSEPTKRQQIANRLQSKEHRDAFVNATIRFELPAQIREMRASRGWSQADLGNRTDMKQGAISRLESSGYEGFTLRTLRKLASAFDVGLKVRFVPFSELVDDAASPAANHLDVLCFHNDRAMFQTNTQGAREPINPLKDSTFTFFNVSVAVATTPASHWPTFFSNTKNLEDSLDAKEA